jgi:hypothetical protein
LARWYRDGQRIVVPQKIRAAFKAAQHPRP